ncbi:MAG: RluA family pseudouridine synthase [Rhodospirillaceae bacterium]|jgi:23S rRNA pseudouridine955/2504/2580 synthase|nr:RluA family pseudouridine synthase [Rhodospirillaceae bacterium]MBT3930917.1 RluA family pseudouridine synthase [Rhodospirillaceae bacterium]MBT4771884.1 RluA family pseudouridine synthase [Rhodospirillaceae bacterium]MBT5358487.1 RluA family pseudouridine synthase [Rhodospirillaceae bacterium]MBT5768840.1 RluA family pseudouridine synthase [Rhodospirillaceae bacterium]
MSPDDLSAVRHIAVQSDDGDVRLDRWFKRHYPDVSYGQVAKWLRTGQVRVDGHRAKPGQRLSEGQDIRVPPMPATRTVEPPAERNRQPVDRADAAILRESIIYQDEFLIALNKPAGLAVQGGSKTHRHLDGMLDALQFDAKDRPRLVHRLDKDTSGLLLLARDRRTASQLSVLFQGREVEKTYWALVVGVPDHDSGVIDARLAKRGGEGSERVESVDDGQAAETEYRILDHAARRISWLELRPRTGRTHQLRAHCKVMGTPIVGDGKYGGRESDVEGLPRRLHLHARGLTLPHPTTGERLTLAAPLDDVLSKSWAFVGFDAKVT